MLDSSFPSLRSIQCDAHILVYKLEQCDDKDHAATISLIIRILPDMSISVFIGDEKLPGSELKWALSHTRGKLKYWSQLENIFIKYSSRTVEVSGAVRSKMVAELIEEMDTTTEHQQHTLHFLAEQLKLTFASPKGEDILLTY